MIEGMEIKRESWSKRSKEQEERRISLHTSSCNRYHPPHRPSNPKSPPSIDTLPWRRLPFSRRLTTLDLKRAEATTRVLENHVEFRYGRAFRRGGRAAPRRI